MKYLLDTHILIWSITATSKLSKKVLSILNDRNNEIVVSAISLWEISIKFRLGNLDIGIKLPIDFIFECENLGFTLIQLSPKEAGTFYNLKSTFHKDPFDRMLIWQAISNNFTFISDDDNLKKYASEGLKVIW